MSKMKDVCLQHGCIKCCLDTEMPLSSSDIVRIGGLGFSKDFFIVEKNGNRQLKNTLGRCVFHNGQGCIIYGHRPEGCRVYPAVFHEDTGEVVLDSYCPHHGKFRLTPIIARKVIRLVQKLDYEKKTGRHQLRKGRRSTKAL